MASHAMSRNVHMQDPGGGPGGGTHGLQCTLFCLGLDLAPRHAASKAQQQHGPHLRIMSNWVGHKD